MTSPFPIIDFLHVSLAEPTLTSTSTTSNTSCLESNNYDETVSCYKTLMKAKPVDFRISLSLAHVSLKWNKFDDAIQYARQSLNMCSDCENFAARRLLQEIEERKSEHPLFHSSAGFLGVVDMSENDFYVAPAWNLTFQDALFTALQSKKISVIKPDIEKIMEQTDLKMDSEAACAMEITKAAGLSFGIYVTIEETHLPKDVIVTLHTVRESGVIIERVFIVISKKELQNAHSTNRRASELASVFEKTLKRKRN
ncbi:MAG: hypothetical protein A3I05_04240 [Deltaproteobacteria bacterium RIFCSPLOWO2_02_FULL_44_10]|nr:MAG: hypothetical protein A3C46_07055 [Deltaproteobacteria bacterium RIFCSPHIGHO2_02_FULL_44_16]OGQ46576.1 MAG: hypothetical protein A3I05_04240 [Deltaproteobacteria bacterium RIFCSPLOWO2_02_FULL_44_10]